MNKIAEMLRARLAEKQDDLNNALNAVRNFESTCKHNWVEEYTPIHREGYTIPAVSLGSDSTPEMYISPSTTDKWTRTCTECGKIEHTTSSKEEKIVKKKASW